MKFIARRCFLRTPELAEVEIIGGCKGATQPVAVDEKDASKGTYVPLRHKNHIHIGAIFELGTSKTEAELRQGKDPARQLIAKLRVAQAISNAGDPEEVAHIEEVIATDNKREQEAEKRNSRVAINDATDKLVLLVEKLLGKLAAPEASAKGAK
jgi:hypothetical protein